MIREFTSEARKKYAECDKMYLHTKQKKEKRKKNK